MGDNNTSGGISALSLLGVVFVTLKLCGVIEWSWWWVTAPFWAPVAIVIVWIVVICGVMPIAVFASVVFLWEKLTEK